MDYSVPSNRGQWVFLATLPDQSAGPSIRSLAASPVSWEVAQAFPGLLTPFPVACSIRSQKTNHRVVNSLFTFYQQHFFRATLKVGSPKFCSGVFRVNKKDLKLFRKSTHYCLSFGFSKKNIEVKSQFHSIPLSCPLLELDFRRSPIFSNKNSSARWKEGKIRISPKSCNINSRPALIAQVARNGSEEHPEIQWANACSAHAWSWRIEIVWRFLPKGRQLEIVGKAKQWVIQENQMNRKNTPWRRFSKKGHVMAR